jgi:Fe-S-cluster-containing hydrogenase component 2
MKKRHDRRDDGQKGEGLSRRDFVKAAAMSVAAVGGSGILSSPSALGERLRLTEKVAPSKGVILVAKDRCTGCEICEVVCSLVKDGKANGGLTRIQVSGSEIDGEFFKVGVCQQCVEPKCVRACPVQAIKADPKTGARVVDEKACAGCDTCMAACTEACPFTPANIRYDVEKKVAVKCDLCGGDPQCVKFCMHNAMTYFTSEKGVRSGYPFKTSKKEGLNDRREGGVKNG